MMDASVDGGETTNTMSSTRGTEVTDNQLATFITEPGPCAFVSRHELTIKVRWKIGGRVTRWWTGATGGTLLGSEGRHGGEWNIHVKGLVVKRSVHVKSGVPYTWVIREVSKVVGGLGHIHMTRIISSTEARSLLLGVVDSGRRF
jgi:hypothetical protein